MKAPIYRILRRTIPGCLLGMLGGLLCLATVCAAATVERIDAGAGGRTLQVGLDRRAEFKVLQLGAREIMVAFKASELAPKAAGNLTGRDLIKQITVEKLPDRAVSLKIDTSEDIREVQAEWQGNSPILLVRLVSIKSASKTEIPVKHRRFKKKDILGASGGSGPGTVDQSPQSAPESASKAQPPPSPDESAQPEQTGPEQTGTYLTQPITSLQLTTGTDAAAPASDIETDAEDLLTQISRKNCTGSPVMSSALALCQKNKWEAAFKLLDTGLNPTAKDPCQAERYYLKAYAASRMSTSGDDRMNLDAVSYFQDALSYYPDVSYAPSSMLILGGIYDQLGSNAEAMGYFKLILKTYPDLPEAADAMLNLGLLYAKEQKQDLAVSTFRQFIKDYPQSRRLTDVRLALGKSLYEENEFSDSLAMLTRVAADDPRRIYEDPDLLEYIGNLNYQLGNMDSAREAMAKAVNLFPQSDAVPVLLTRIGDTLRDSGRKEQAKKIYELVMKRYPDTDGFAISAIRYADLLSNRSEKEAQYRMVIDRFSGHPMAKLAVVRLADLQYQEGDYSASIETLRGVISEDLKSLKDDAEYVMAAAYGGYFRQLAERGDPLASITVYEKDKSLINRFENPDIFEMVGTAFFRAKLFTQAKELFQKSYKASSADKRPASLYYHFAVTLQELGENMQAREMFSAYFQKAPKGEKNPDAYLRMGRLLVSEKSYETALKFIWTGLEQSTSNMQKAQFLMTESDAYGNMGKEQSVPDILIKAINLMVSSPEVSNEQLMKAHRRLGESYMKLSDFDKAGEAFTMALKFSGGNRPPALLFLLAESDLKAQNPEAARTVLSEMLNCGDAFWVRMAKEKLQSIALDEKMKDQAPTATTSVGQ